MRQKLFVFASGSADGGGSGFATLCRASVQGLLSAKIVGVASNYPNGGVRQKADTLGVPFMFFPGPWTGDRYQRIAEESQADFFALSGWLKWVCGLDLSTRFNSRTVFNIHPGRLPQTAGTHGHLTHEKTLECFRKGELTSSAVTMHFVTENVGRRYDEGPPFLWSQVPILNDDTPESLGKRVNAREHERQPWVTDLVVRGAIRWDGMDRKSLVLPAGYDPSF